MKVEFTKLISANVIADNKNDETRNYDITCNVNIYEGNVTNLEAGRVVKDGTEIATFSRHSNGRLSIVFNVDKAERNPIMEEIDAMYNDIVEKVTNKPISI